MRRVVITGMGMVSPLGVGVDHNWTAITNGRSGITNVSHFDVSDISSKIAGVIPRSDESTNDGRFHVEDFVSFKDQKKMDEFIIFAMTAATEAVEDSGFVADTEEKQWRTGVLIGSGIGGLQTISQTTLSMEEKGTKRISPFFIPSSLINLASGHVSIKYGFKGPNHAVVTACATGTHAIGDAARLIMFGDADVMVAGGTESSVNRIGMAGFAAARALSSGHNNTPTKASRPFDEGRDGFVIAEGAGVVVLEEYEHAKARGAKIYAEVKGYGLSGDANHITAPAADGNGGYRAMEAALRNSGMNADDIQYINAHGTSTPVGDGIELGAVKRMFKNSLDSISMSSTKSSIGHLLGAAGAVEAIYTAKTLQTGVISPTLNLDNPSEEAQGLDLVPHVAKEKNITAAISNSFGFGGTNASIILTKV